MKKTIFTRLAAVLLSAVMVFAMAAGCKNGSEGDDIDNPGANGGNPGNNAQGGPAYEAPEFVYVAETIKFPDGINDVWNFAVSGDKLYFATSNYEYNEETMENHYGYTLYSMNLDGTGLTELKNYTPPVDVPEGANGGISLNSLNADGEGNLWVAERYSFYILNLPDGFDPERDEWLPGYHQELDSDTIIRKLDATGTELLSVDLSVISAQTEFFYINTFGVDMAGNIYLVVDDWDRGGRIIHVLDSSGSKIFELTTESWFNNFITLSDGSLAFTEGVFDSGPYRQVLRSIDAAAKGFGRTEDLPQNAWNVYPGSGDFDILFNYDGTVYGYTFGEEEPVRLLNWMESDILDNGIENITMLPDGRIFCTCYTWNSRTEESGTEILLLTKTPYSELPVKTIITLAALETWNIRDAVVRFNKESSGYRIQVIDYSQYNNEDDWTAGMTRLTAEIISGKSPDIIYLSYQLAGKYNEYAKKGLFLDLYPLIDSDPGMSRSDFIEAPLKAAEVDGCLYQAFKSFGLNTIIGNPSAVGPGIGWNMDEFKAALDNNPQADMPLGQWLSKESFLQTAIAYSIDEYIDWADGTANFDTPEFIKLLEYTNMLPDPVNLENAGMNWDDYYVSEEDAIPQGRQIMALADVSGIYWYMYYKVLFGGEVAFKGFPNESRNGNSFSINNGVAITANSPNKEGAWSFVKTFFTEDVQLSDSRWMRGGLPANKAAFDAVIDEALNMREGSYGINSIGIPVPQREDVDAIMELMNRTSGLASWNLDEAVWSIINESVSDYYSGIISARDAARVIQNRMAIYVSERS